jgi:hypothetical protein
VLFPFFYLVFDLYCLFNKRISISVCLNVIATLNLSYCVFAIAAAIWNRGELTVFGWLFVFLESVVIIMISSFEFKVARNLVGFEK